MPLDKQLIPVSFSQGVDTKTDSKQTIIGKMVSLVNAVFEMTKEFSKRNGFTARTQVVQNASPLAAGISIQSYNSELVELDGSSLYSFNASGPNWVNKGKLVKTQIATKNIIRDINTQQNGDSAVIGNYQAFAWIETSFTGGASELNYSIFDLTTGQAVVANQTLYSNSGFTAGPVKVLANGTNFVFIYYDAVTFSSLYYNAVSSTNITTLGSQTTIATDLDASNFAFDAEVIGNNIIIAYGAASSKVAVYQLSQGLVLSGQYIAETGDTVTHITVYGDSSLDNWITYVTSSAIKTVITNPNITANVLSATTTVTTTNVVNLTGIVTGTIGTIYYETGVIGSSLNPSLYNNYTNVVTISKTGSTTAPTVVLYGIGLASKVFSYNSIYYLYVMFPTALQSLYFLIDQTGSVVAKFSQGDGGFINENKLLPEVNVLSTGTYQTTVQIREALVDNPRTQVTSAQSSGGSAYSTCGVQSIWTNFIPQWPSKPVLGNNLHYTGGVFMMYDGSSVVEHGYHIYPEGLIAAVTGHVGSGIGPGASTAAVNQIQYCAVYRWVDQEGQYHESCPSIPVTVILPSVITPVTFTGNTTGNSPIVTSVSSTSGLVIGQVVSDTNFVAGTYIVSINSSTSITLSTNATATATGASFSTKDLGAYIVDVPPLRVTAKPNNAGRNSVAIDLYRTQNNLDIFYKVATVLNDPTQTSLAILDITPDNLIIGNQQLYTTGGEVENIAVPAVSVATIFKNRVLAVPYESQLSWWYSKQTIPGVPVEFNDAFLENVDERIGAITAIGSVDEKIILFGSNTKFYVVGDGPAPSGVNNDFTEAQKIAGVTGCTNQASLVDTEVGLIYQDPTKGIYLLDRSLEESYIGADVEAYNGYLVTSAHVIPGQTIVRFTLNNGVSLTYDYFVKQWGTDLYLSAAVDSCIYNLAFNDVTSAGLVSYEDPTVNTDNGQFVPMSLQTGWLSFAQILGYQRVMEMQILGQYYSPHTLTVNFYVDNSGVAAQTAVIPVLSDPVLYDFKISLNDRVQRSTMLQVSIVESQTSPYGEGLSLSGISFRVGIKSGLNKVPATKSY